VIWRLEPYSGSEFDSLRRLPRFGVGGRRILVNNDLPATLRRELSRHNPSRLSITIGNRFEAYPAAEQRFAITRSILDVLGEATGFELKLTTRSPLVLRDQDLIRRLDMNHSVTVYVPIATLDGQLAAQLEPNAPDPASRLEIVRRLAIDGIAVVVSCSPILPGINNSADELDPLFAAVHQAGALDVIGNIELVSSRNRQRIAAWLDEFAPDRASTVLTLLANGSRANHLGTLERLRLAYGFPVLRSGRG
jgi:DNA repair photolyase